MTAFSLAKPPKLESVETHFLDLFYPAIFRVVPSKAVLIVHVVSPSHSAVWGKSNEDVLAFLAMLELLGIVRRIFLAFGQRSVTTLSNVWAFG